MQHPKHILMVGTQPDANGGIAAVISLYRKNGLFQRRNIIYLATHSNGTKAAKAKLLSIALARLAGLLLRQRVSILHVHVASNASFWRKSLFLAVAGLWGIPTVLHLHAGPFPAFYAERCGPLRRYLVRQVLCRVDNVLVVSTALNQWVRSICRPCSVVTLFNPAVVSCGQDAVCEGARDASTLLFLGNLGKAKGTFDLLRAMPAVLDEVPGATLMLCGDGDIAGTTRLIEQLSLGHCVKVLGWIDEHRRAELLSSASLYVLPSYAEGLPMSILEAMAAGLPAVATRVGGVPEVITHESDGLLVEPGDVDMLGASILRLLKYPEQARKLAAAACATVREKFGADKTITPLEGLYEELLAGRRRRCGRRRAGAQAAGCAAIRTGAGERTSGVDRQEQR